MSNEYKKTYKYIFSSSYNSNNSKLNLKYKIVTPITVKRWKNNTTIKLNLNSFLIDLMLFSMKNSGMNFVKTVGKPRLSTVDRMFAR